MSARAGHAGRAASLLLLTLLTLALYGPALRCLEGCYLDYAAIRAGDLGRLEPADARLNSWILAWVQRSLLHAPRALFDGNIFHPAPRVITQSEHLLGVAVPMLPVRALGGDAVAVHQAALVLSALLLGLTTRALVRWLTDSEFAALAAGAAALAMPWRLAELSHVQLLSAQWFPLVWLQTARIALGERAPRQVAILALALALQLLSSFYLAYYLCASLALLLLALAWCGAPLRRAASALVTAALPAFALFVAAALPYLAWSASTGFQGPRPIESIAPSDVWSYVGPRLGLGWRGTLPIGVSYEVPLALCILAAVGVVGAWRDAGGERAQRRRALALGLAALCVASLVLALGERLELGTLRLPLPGAFARRLVPGYENLRNPLRWAIAAGLAAPVLAGLGVARLEAWLASARQQLALRVAVVLALATGLPWVALPVRDAWQDWRQHQPLYRELAALPPGPVVELPWLLPSARGVEFTSRYVLASTLHWQPLLDGVSGYVPPSSHLLRQVAQALPAPRALERLYDLSGLRYIVVHLDALPPAEQPAWHEAVRAGRLTRLAGDASSWILALPDFGRAPRWLEAVASPAPRALTLTGLSRAPLALTEPAGRLELLARAPFILPPDWTRPLRVAIENGGDAAWAGFDVQPEGLVRVRYSFLDAHDGIAAQGLAALAEDVPARSRVELDLPLRGPVALGSYRLRLELVQQLAGEEHALPVPALWLPAEVRSLPGRAQPRAGG